MEQWTLKATMGTALILAVVTAWGAQANGSGSVAAGRVLSVRGRVEIQRNNGTQLVRYARVGADLYPGDVLRTGADGAAKVQVNGTTLDVGPDTELRLRHSDPARPGRSWLQVILGRIRSVVVGDREFVVGTEAAAAVSKGTVFALEVRADQTAVLTVGEGSVEFYNDQGRVVVNAGEQSSATPNTAPTRPSVVDVSGVLVWEAALPNMATDVEQLFSGPRTEEELKAAVTEGQRQTQANPTATDLMKLGDALHDSDQGEAAAEAYDRAAAAGADAAIAGYRAGSALLREGRPDEAAARFGKLATQPGGSGWAQLGQALLLLAGGGATEAGKAVPLLKASASAGPPAGLALAFEGFACLRTGDLASACSALDQARAADEKCYQAQAYTTYAKLAAGDVPAALAASARAVELAPLSALSHEARGYALFFSGDLAAADREAVAALARDPQRATACALL